MPTDKEQADQIDVTVHEPDGTISKSTIQMTPETAEMLRVFRWRMTKARELVEYPAELSTLLAAGTSEMTSEQVANYLGLIRAALVAYIRENSD